MAYTENGAVDPNTSLCLGEEHCAERMDNAYGQLQLNNCNGAPDAEDVTLRTSDKEWTQETFFDPSMATTVTQHEEANATRMDIATTPICAHGHRRPWIGILCRHCNFKHIHRKQHV